MSIDNLVWAEKYRPQTLADAILPEATKQMVSDAIENDSVPHFLFTGSAGTGKTTLARIIAKTLDCDLLFINASLETGIDNIRMKVVQYASSVSFSGNGKMVLFDEFDGSSPAAQQSLRGIIEEFPTTRFIFTCNFKNKVIDAIHSRCVVVDFKTTKEESPKLQMKFFKRVAQILDLENITYDKAAVAALVKKYYPDFRRTLNELQRYASGGKIDAGILLNQSESQFTELIGHLQAKNFKEMRNWVGSNPDIDPATIFRTLYDMSATKLAPACIPNIILILADYSYKSAFVSDPQIVVAACLVEFMTTGVWV